MEFAKVYRYRKRVRETTPGSTSNAGKNVRPLCDLDLDILECPICTEPLCPPVYQCQNGHALCSACHAEIYRCPSCSETIGITRNLLAEKILESLQVRCEHASHGCKQMLKYSTREEHIKNLCDYRPCSCPVPGCMHEGPKHTLLQHLEKMHKVKTIPLHLSTTPGLRKTKFQISVPSDAVWTRFVLVKDVDQKVKLLLHREAIETLGHLFFCTTFEDHAVKYDLKVSLELNGESHTMIANASAEDIRQRENWKRDALLFYTGGSQSKIILTFDLSTDVQVDTDEGVRDLTN